MREWLHTPGKHHMPSLFLGRGKASLGVSGRVLPGQAIPCDVAGPRISTAMLAFPETGIQS